MRKSTVSATDQNLMGLRNIKSDDRLQADKAMHQAMWKLGVKHPNALSVLHFMVSKLSHGTNTLMISVAALAKQMGIAPRTVQNTIRVLKDCNFIQVTRLGNVNLYIINACMTRKMSE